MKELSLNEKLSRIQIEFKANKSRFNSFGKYNFRSAEDILEGLKPFNEKYGVSFTITEKLVSWATDHAPIIESVATIYDNNGVNEMYCSAIVGVDLNQKGMQVPQQFGSASSYAKKYALGNLLLIDDTQDADAVNKHDSGIKITDLVDDKKWLNKNTPEFTKSIEYLKSGGNIEAIEKKYKLAKAVKDELLKVK
jgi:ERF superfamily